VCDPARCASPRTDCRRACELVEDLGDSAIVDLQAGESAIRMRCVRRPGVREGENVHLAFDVEAIHIFDATTGARV